MSTINEKSKPKHIPVININATEYEGLKTHTLHIALQPLTRDVNTKNITQAVKNACRDFIRTKEGIKVMMHNCGQFNWSDFETYVPNTFCEKYGFKRISCDENDLNVDWNENLISQQNDRKEKIIQ